MRVGFVGLGAMGSGIVRRLLAAGRPVTGWNRTRAKAEPLVEAGMAWADTPREAAAGADVVFSMLTDAKAVHAAFEGDDGILAGLGPGTRLRRHEHDRARTRAARSRSGSPRPARRCWTRRSRAAWRRSSRGRCR